MLMTLDLLAAVDLTTLLIAAVGAFAGIGSLIFTIWQFRLSGPRLVVEIKRARIGGASIITGGRSWDSADARTLAAHPILAVSIHVANRGRMATTIQSWGVDVGAGMIFQQTNLILNPQLPVKIDAGASVTFLAELSEVLAGNHAAAKTLGGRMNRVYGQVTRGDGRTIRSRRQLWLS